MTVKLRPDRPPRPGTIERKCPGCRYNDREGFEYPCNRCDEYGSCWKSPDATAMDELRVILKVAKKPLIKTIVNGVSWGISLYIAVQLACWLLDHASIAYG